jgi:hypothetical protein
LGFGQRHVLQGTLLVVRGMAQLHRPSTCISLQEWAAAAILPLDLLSGGPAIAFLRAWLLAQPQAAATSQKARSSYHVMPTACQLIFTVM